MTGLPFLTSLSSWSRDAPETLTIPAPWALAKLASGAGAIQWAEPPFLDSVMLR